MRTNKLTLVTLTVLTCTTFMTAAGCGGSGESDSGGTTDTDGSATTADDGATTDTTDSGTTDEGTTDEGTTDQGSTDATDQGSTDATDQGSTDATDQGTTDATDQGSTDATDQGTTDATDQGTTDEGTTDEGTTDEGTTDEGTTDEGTTDSSGTGTDDGGGTGSDAISETPNAELLVKIIGPPGQNQGKSHVAVLSGVTPLTGIAFGDPDKIEWTSSNTDSGIACDNSIGQECSAFWQSSAIPLVPGVNIVTVKAHKGEQVVQDKIHITYNPQFLFDAEPTVAPNMMWVNESTKGIVSVPITLYSGGIVENSVKLWKVDVDGNPIGGQPLKSMSDNGKLGNCDEIVKDGVYSACLTNFKCTNANEDLWMAVSVEVKSDFANYTAYSAPVRIECASRIPKGECSAAQTTLQDARAQWSNAGGQDDPIAARDATIAWLKQQNNVTDAGPSTGDGNGVWVEYKAGFLGALNLNPEGFRGGSLGAAGSAMNLITQQSASSSTPFNTHSINSKKALVLAPYWNEFSADSTDEAPEIATLLEESSCPTFSVDGAKTNTEADLQTFRSQYLYGVIALSSHGDTYFEGLGADLKKKLDWDHQGSQEVIWSGEKVNCNGLTTINQSCNAAPEPGKACPAGKNCCSNGQECVITGASGTNLSGVCVDRTQMDLRKGRVILGDATWGMAATFVSRHTKRRMPNSLVYLGACRSLHVGTFAAEYIASGAKSVAGYSGYVHSAFAADSGIAFFTNMLKELDLTGSAFFKVEPQADPESPNEIFRMFGATNLDIMNADLINPSFETSDLTGWNRDGDGRVIAQLGISIPVHGKFMGLISTGLGFTVQTGEIYQNFCIPGDKTSMQFYWKFFSEEFKEWCGSTFQDTFQATLQNDQGKLTLVNTKIDDLCHYDDGSCAACPDPGVGNCECGSQYVGLIPSDVVFDQGGVYNIQWQLGEKDVTPLAGQGPVELKFFATDTGDSIYDTVILIDAVVFK